MTAGSNLSVENELIVEKIANLNPCAFNGSTAGKLRLQAKVVDNTYHGTRVRYAGDASRGAVVGVVGACHSYPCRRKDSADFWGKEVHRKVVEDG